LGGPQDDGHPDLADMTAQALRLMEDSESGFFLMVESGAGNVPGITWTTTGHTSRSLDLYTWGFKCFPFRIFQ
jgi:hypothetical protein